MSDVLTFPLDTLVSVKLGEFDAICRDAKRYRWLRDKCELSSRFRLSFHTPGPDDSAEYDYEQHRQWCCGMSKETLDAAIDAALADKQEPG